MQPKLFLKNVLQQINVYYPLQKFYRGGINKFIRHKNKLAYTKFKGNGFTCNCCNAQYERFIPEYPSPNIAAAINTNDVIAGFGENVFCPNCGSKNRERLILDILQNEIDCNNKKVLLFAPEKNIYNYLKQVATLTTVDIEPQLYKPIDKAVQFADATHLQFDSESFDIVIANHILEHIPNDDVALQQLYRVLKPNGVAILQVPYSKKLQQTIEDKTIKNPALQEQLFAQKDHVRIYAYANYIERLQAANFTVKVLQPDYLIKYQQHAIQQNECVFLACK